MSPIAAPDVVVIVLDREGPAAGASAGNAGAFAGHGFVIA